MDPIYRTASSGDEDALYALLVEMHAENAREPISESRVRARIRQCIQQGSVIIAEIDGEVAGSIGLMVERRWWTDAEHMADAWIFVRRAFRATRLFPRLMNIGVETAASMGIPFEPALVSTTDLERKNKLFLRRFSPKGFLYTTEE